MSIHTARLLVLALFTTTLLMGEPVGDVPAKFELKPGARIAIAGDSITQQALYSRMIELYLQACMPQLQASVLQLGKSGEQTAGFDRRLANDLLFWSPTLVTLAYGMNDGGYQPYSDDTGEAYKLHLTSILQQLHDANIQPILGTPGIIGANTFRRDPEQAASYNDSLQRLTTIAKEVAAPQGIIVADINTTMRETLTKGKAALGDSFHLTGPDGVHPLPRGHLVMAYCFLKAMGLNGDIGTFTLDWGGEATASEGHHVQSTEDGHLTIISSRYPFCFSSGPADTASVLPFLPFNEELNRFTLTVHNLPTQAARVTWGQEERQFSREQLARGINLAQEFLNNPFQEPFLKMDLAIAAKQRYEITMVKSLIANFPDLKRRFPDDEALDTAINVVQSRLLQEQERLTLEVRGLLEPVTHTIIITPIEE